MKADYPRLYGAPLTDPEQARLLLRDPVLHWKKGRSAYELSHAWLKSDGLPGAVADLIGRAPEWAQAQVIAGFFEHGTALDTMTGPSWTDLLLVVRALESLGVIAVEGKAGESFGPLVSDWNSSVGRQARLAWACSMFGIAETTAASLRWQLFHRTASAVLEARRFCAPKAMLLVHDFSPNASSIADFAAFTEAIGFADAGVGKVTAPRDVGGVSLRLAWLATPAIP